MKNYEVAPTNLRIHSCKVWNANTVLAGQMDKIRIRGTELHDVGQIEDGAATNVKTRANDRW